ncbi:MAG: CHAT domain-containing protein [Myxococcota bacterium]|nr:CHAT domain-containing protein [Myxococcota bacterium]
MNGTDIELRFEAPFPAPLGVVETDELRWYLEVYPGWPLGVFRERAMQIEGQLRAWGEALFAATLGHEGRADELAAWCDAAADGRPTLTVRLVGDGDEEAGARLLGLPWELMFADGGPLSGVPAVVRRQREVAGHAELPAPSEPLRILLLVARPEAEGLLFIDPRAAAAPLVEVLSQLGRRAELTVPRDGTLEALRDALDQAQADGAPYHVVHFDGHGVVDEARGVGQLCFEFPEDVDEDKLARRPALVDADMVGELLADRGVPLVLLEACQTASSRVPVSASVASALLERGVPSVVAMSHTVRADTTRRFVDTFYAQLAACEPISAAVARGERGQPALQDWFVPVLFQAPGGDGALLMAGEIGDAALRTGVTDELPPPPPHGFVGRAWDLTVLERRLRTERWLTVVGDGGQGKTSLAVEAARWQQGIRRFGRVAFVSVEQHAEARGALDRLGRQLIPGFSVAAQEGRGDRDERLERLAGVGDTRLLLTSRTLPPPPFDGGCHRLGPLSRGEGVQLVGRVLSVLGPGRAGADEDDSAWAEEMVDRVGGHARSLVLLTPLVAAGDARTTAADLASHMADLERDHPGERERSLLASVRLSLDALPPVTRSLLPPLAVFRGHPHVAAMAPVLGVTTDRAMEVCRELVRLGLADAEGPFLVPDPALTAALDLELSTADRVRARARWLEVIQTQLQALYDQHFRESHLAAQGTTHALGDLLAALSRLEAGVGVGNVDAEGHEVLRRIQEGDLQGASRTARTLAERAEAMGDVYPEAEFDRAMARWLVGRVRLRSGDAQAALGPLDDAHLRFMRLAEAGTEGARRMASVTLAELGDALRHLGRLDEAGDALRRANHADEKRGDMRQLASARVSLGIVHLRAGRLRDALETFHRARAVFEEMDDPGSVAHTWHQIGTVHDSAGAAEEAERAYQRALRLRTQAEDRAGEAITLVQLGNLYRDTARADEAVSFFAQAAAIFGELGDNFREAGARSNLGLVLHAAGRRALWPHGPAVEGLGVAGGCRASRRRRPGRGHGAGPRPRRLSGVQAGRRRARGRRLAADRAGGRGVPAARPRGRPACHPPGRGLRRGGPPAARRPDRLDQRHPRPARPGHRPLPLPAGRGVRTPGRALAP